MYSIVHMTGRHLLLLYKTGNKGRGAWFKSQSDTTRTPRLHGGVEAQSASMEYSTFHLLALPRELRDSIFEYALADEDYQLTEDLKTPSNRRIKGQITGNERWAWSVQYASEAPRCTYLSLLCCNKQLKIEMQEYASRIRDPLSAKLLLVMEYPDLWPAWHHVPGAPSQINVLDILIKADHMYHPAFMSRGPYNAILTTVYETVKRYIHRGPHLARPSPLHHPLKLDTVRVTLAPPVPFEEMTYVYGFPAQQLEALFDEFKGLMQRLCRSGLMSMDVGAFEIRLVGREYDRILVTSNIWDEDDHVFFDRGGYSWDIRVS